MIMNLHIPLPRRADDGKWRLSNDGTFVGEEFPEKRIRGHHQSISRPFMLLLNLLLMMMDLLLLLLLLLRERRRRLVMESSIRRGVGTGNIIPASGTNPPDSLTLRFHAISRFIEAGEEPGVIEVMWDFHRDIL